MKKVAFNSIKNQLIFEFQIFALLQLSVSHKGK
jgi:hypothetical protein